MKLLILSIILSFNTYALALAKVDIAPTKKIGKTNLVLNGAGIRKATWLKVKVYVGSLYVLKKTSNIQKLLNQNGPKHLTMHFVRNVNKEKLINGWQNAFERSLESEELKKYKNSITLFKESTRDMNKNETVELTIYKESLEYSIKGKKQNPIIQPGFANKLLSVWFINAEDQGLKEGLLGKNN